MENEFNTGALLERERAKLQNFFTLLNNRGSRMKVSESGKIFLETLVDSYMITRVAPVFDMGGVITKCEFWLLWKSVGYDEGYQYAHTVKIVKVVIDDTLEEQINGVTINAWIDVNLTDDRNRIYHIELIEPGQEAAFAEDWQTWQSYKSINKELFARIDNKLLEEHTRIAQEWQ